MMTMRKTTRLLAALTLAGAFGGIGACDLYQSQESRAWPSVPGKVVHSALGFNQTHSALGDNYRPDVQYDFQVDGRDYFGDTIGFGDEQGTEAFVKSQLARYPVGKPVQVFYDPSDPRHSCLEPGRAGHGAYLFFTGAALMLAIGILAAIADRAPDPDPLDGDDITTLGLS